MPPLILPPNYSVNNPASTHKHLPLVALAVTLVNSTESPGELELPPATFKTLTTSGIHRPNPPAPWLCADEVKSVSGRLKVRCLYPGSIVGGASARLAEFNLNRVTCRTWHSLPLQCYRPWIMIKYDLGAALLKVRYTLGEQK